MEQHPTTLWKFLESESQCHLGLAKRLDIAKKLVDEVKKAHSSRLAHRDLKPTNLMFDANGEVALIDFGIARDWKGLEGSCGTPGFAAPEQISGDRQDKHVDIFSLGKNLALIGFKWKVGWTLLWSSKEFISAHEAKLSLFADFSNIIRQMLQVRLNMLLH